MEKMSEVRIRPLVWVGDARRALKSFPQQVRKEIGDALFQVQLGVTPRSAKLLKGLGETVFEIVQRYNTDTYRAVYAVALGESIYILHAFQKKSTSGINTRKSDLDLICKRLKAAKERENP